jgi:hypothetical protein
VFGDCVGVERVVGVEVESERNEGEGCGAAVGDQEVEGAQRDGVSSALFGEVVEEALDRGEGVRSGNPDSTRPNRVLDRRPPLHQETTVTWYGPRSIWPSSLTVRGVSHRLATSRVGPMAMAMTSRDVASRRWTG